MCWQVFGRVRHTTLQKTAVERCDCSLFLFLCQTKVHGKDRVKFTESLVVADIAELKDNQVDEGRFHSEAAFCSHVCVEPV